MFLRNSYEEEQKRKEEEAAIEKAIVEANSKEKQLRRDLDEIKKEEILDISKYWEDLFKLIENQVGEVNASYCLWHCNREAMEGSLYAPAVVEHLSIGDIKFLIQKGVLGFLRDGSIWSSEQGEFEYLCGTGVFQYIISPAILAYTDPTGIPQSIFRCLHAGHIIFPGLEKKILKAYLPE